MCLLQIGFQTCRVDLETRNRILEGSYVSGELYNFVLKPMFRNILVSTFGTLFFTFEELLIIFAFLRATHKLTIHWERVEAVSLAHLFLHSSFDVSTFGTVSVVGGNEQVAGCSLLLLCRMRQKLMRSREHPLGPFDDMTIWGHNSNI